MADKVKSIGRRQMKGVKKISEKIILNRTIRNSELDNIFYKKAVLDYNDLLGDIKMLTSDEAKRLLLIQTTEGHARKGHGRFGSSSKSKPIYNYLNVSIDAVADALENSGVLQKFHLNKQEVKEERQKLIDEITSWAESACNYYDEKKKTNFLQNLLYNKIPEGLLHLKNADEEPLMRIPLLKNIKIENPKLVLKGMYLASLMDSIEWRKKTTERYRNTNYLELMGLKNNGFKIGGGTCLAVNPEKLKSTKIEEIIGEEAKNYEREFGSFLSLDFLSQFGFEEHLQKLYDKGIVIPEDMESSENIVSGYVRHIRAPGVSDDLALIIAGAKYGIEAAYGVYLVDAIDTIDKYTPKIFFGGQDERFGEQLIKKLPQLASDDEITSFIALIYNKNRKQIADSSQRRFLQIQFPAGISALESHLNFIKSREYCPLLFFGFSQVPASDFYAEAEHRIGMIDTISRI